MDLQYYLLRLKSGTCSGRQNVFAAFRYKFIVYINVKYNGDQLVYNVFDM